MPIPGVMTRFRIDELSGVDKAAQEGARAVLMKRAGDPPPTEPYSYDSVMKRNFTDRQRKQLADTGKALPDGSFPIENEGDLHNAISAIGRAKDGAKAKGHIIARAKAMGMTGALPEDWTSKGLNMDKALICKALGLPETSSDADIAAAVAKNAASVGRAAWLVTLSKARSTDLDYAKASDMQPEDDDAEDGKKGDKAKKFAAFLAKTEAERDIIIAKHREGDETLTANGVTISKREVGPAMFAFARAQAEASARDKSAMEKAISEASDATFRKDAVEKFSHVAGTVDERVSMLKGIAAITDETARKAAMRGIEVAEAAGKIAFSRVGKTAAGLDGGIAGDSADDKIAAKAKELQKGDPKLTIEKAMDRVLSENPDLYEASKAEQRERARGAN